MSGRLSGYTPSGSTKNPIPPQGGTGVTGTPLKRDMSTSRNREIWVNIEKAASRANYQPVIRESKMSDRPLSERMGEQYYDGVFHISQAQLDELAALEHRLRVSEAKREVERDAATDWQEKATALEGARMTKTIRALIDLEHHAQSKADAKAEFEVLMQKIATLEQELATEKHQSNKEITALEQERDEWQEKYEAMKRIADAYHARLEGGEDE